MQSTTGDDLKTFIHELPKVELHIHIEGTLEPELLFKLAKRNSVKLPYVSIEDARTAYIFRSLQDFLDTYYECMNVLLREQDFYDLTMAYLRKAVSHNVYRAEIFFDPQAHTRRGVPFDTVLDGISGALEDGEGELGISSALILCFLRDLNAESAMQTLEKAIPRKKNILGVGLDSAEVGYPPRKFKEVFDLARSEGFLPVAHAGEEGPPEYIWEALNVLKAMRIDHGIQCKHDEKLVKYLIDTQTPLTVCPLSNVRLRIFNKLRDHNFKYLLERGLCVNINSDDPAYFGGYIEENYAAASEALGLTRAQLAQTARNSFIASFMEEEEKRNYIDVINNIEYNSDTKR